MIGDSGSNVAYSYNLNFSPTCIMRPDLMSDDTTGTIDDLSLTYDGNRLIKVTDDADPVLLERSCDFYGQESVYCNNADGALYSDTSRGIEAIEYTPACTVPQTRQRQLNNFTGHKFVASLKGYAKNFLPLHNIVNSVDKFTTK